MHLVFDIIICLIWTCNEKVMIITIWEKWVKILKLLQQKKTFTREEDKIPTNMDSHISSFFKNT